MFKRLLVPLDGSDLAESVLPAALSLADCFHATIVLLHVLEQRPPTTIHGARHLTDEKDAKGYLDDLATRLSKPGLSVERHVSFNKETDVAKSITRHAKELQAGLTILCAHGRSGLREAIVGTIAQQVIHQGITHVLLLRPQPAAEWRCNKILVALDSAPVHEPAMQIAAEFAKMCHAAVHLITVVPTPSTLSGERAAASTFLPNTTNAMLDLAERGAIEYLQRMAGQLAAEGSTVEGQVARGDPASEILSATQTAGADMIALATHGLGSFEAFWAGSVTPRVIAHATVPLLLVRVSEEEAKR